MKPQSLAHHPVLSQIVNESKQRPFIDRVFLFGSRARGDHQASSDIDLAFEFDLNEIMNWLLFKEWLLNESKTLLGIDIVNLNDCHQSLKDQIIKEGLLLYEKPKS